MTGVVLCGGQSRRMGKDKGLLKSSSGVCWSKLAFLHLSVVCSSVAISVNALQLTDYQLHFLPHQLISDDMHLTVKGPLLGILSVHREFPSEDLLVLACDMTDMRLEVLEMLTFEFNQGDYEAAAFLNGDFYEPLCAIYSCGGLRRLAMMQESGELKTNRMQYIVDTLITKRIHVPKSWTVYFSNYNIPGVINFV